MPLVIRLSLLNTLLQEQKGSLGPFFFFFFPFQVSRCKHIGAKRSEWDCPEPETTPDTLGGELGRGPGRSGCCRDYTCQFSITEQPL